MYVKRFSHEHYIYRHKGVRRKHYKIRETENQQITEVLVSHCFLSQHLVFLLPVLFCKSETSLTYFLNLLLVFTNHQLLFPSLSFFAWLRIFLEILRNRFIVFFLLVCNVINFGNILNIFYKAVFPHDQKVRTKF